MLLVALIAVVVSCLAGYYIVQHKYVDKGVCSDDTFAIPRNELSKEHFKPNFTCEGECYFSESYEAASKLFLDSATIAGAKFIPMPVGTDLVTSVAVLEGGQSGKYLVHISGTHGPEGYAGSAIQSAALQYIALNKVYADEESRKSLPTMIFVHANNPYGFKTGTKAHICVEHFVCVHVCVFHKFHAHEL